MNSVGRAVTLDAEGSILASYVAIYRCVIKSTCQIDRTVHHKGCLICCSNYTDADTYW